MAAHPRQKYTLEEYFDLERSTNERFEYWNGDVFAMGGVSEAHDQIETNSIIVIGNTFRGRPCRVFSANMCIKVPVRSPVDCVLELSEVYRDVALPAVPAPNLRRQSESEA